MTTKIFLIRHGATFWNHEHRYQGHTDIELNREGIKQAQALKKRFSTETLDAIYSSDLQRALRTAEIINETHNLSVQICPALKEINFGAWEGLTYQDIEKRYPQHLKIWLEKPYLLHIPQGESFYMVRDRATEAIKAIAGKYPNGSVAVVSHGVTIAAVLCGVQDIQLDKIQDYKNKNASVSILTIDNKNNDVSLNMLNDFSP